ncbi:MAG: hypothetical protein ACT4QD_24900 [Acidobacteriota bacterium]
MIASRPPQPSQERAFVHSVLYASLFEYPLTSAELRMSLIGERANESDVDAWYAASPWLARVIDHSDGYYFPRGRAEFIERRRRREASSRRLLDQLRRPLAVITALPFVRMVSLSGSLAHLNADDDADLDLFVITAPRRVWTVSLTMLLLARLGGWRRRLCLNYVVSERWLSVGPADLYSANQILHLRPLMGIGAYRRFIAANRFVRRFYPNFEPHDVAVSAESAGLHRARGMRILELVLDWTIAPLYERACHLVYGWRLRGRAPMWKSREQVQVDAECLKLHTSSHRRDVLVRFADEVETLTREESRRVRAAG